MSYDGVFTNGEIIKYKHVKETDYSLMFQYEVEGVIYTNTINTGYFKCGDDNEGCVGEMYTIIYSKSNPSVSDVDLGDKNDVKGYFRKYF